MEDKLPYNDFSRYIRRVFPDFKVQKISIDAGFTCPNRDGTVGRGGCTYCNNRTFNPDYCQAEKSVARQLSEGKLFFSRKYPKMKYLAYFQAYTNTYGGLEHLKSLYQEALAQEGIVGLVIGTRPDCMSDKLLDYLQQLSQKIYVEVEYGIESTNDATLKRINRGHDFATSIDAIQRTAERGIVVGGHVILGLPGEGHDELIHQVTQINKLSLTIIKLHQLQIIRGTRLAREYTENPEDFHLCQVDQYIDLVIDYIEHLRPDIVVERFVSQSPKEWLVAPDWGLKNYEFIEKVKKEMKKRASYQGKVFDGEPFLNKTVFHI